MSFGIFRTILGHAGKDWLGVEAQHGKLNVERRVEHGVGSFLIGENPFLLGFAHQRPLADGLLSGVGAFVVVADYAAQQAVVASGNPVVVVERNAGESGYVHLIFV